MVSDGMELAPARSSRIALELTAQRFSADISPEFQAKPPSKVINGALPRREKECRKGLGCRLQRAARTAPRMCGFQSWPGRLSPTNSKHIPTDTSFTKPHHARRVHIPEPAS
jgi:hypothetical protein